MTLTTVAAATTTATEDKIKLELILQFTREGANDSKQAQDWWT